MKTKSYGQAPSNTQLTIKYKFGGGLHHNTPSNTIRTINTVNSTLNSTGLSADLATAAQQSLAVNNTIAATGGRNAESVFEVRQNALAHFQAQSRAVTKQDYIIRQY